MRKLLLALALVAASTGVARAGPAPRAHDGLFLQLDIGGGAFSSEAGDIDVKIDGIASQFSIGIGGAVRENLILAGQMWLATASDPDVESAGASGTLDGSANLVGFGPNLTYYVMPANVYFSATPSLTRLTLADPDGNGGSTELGFGLRLAVGKEWFVGDNFGLGVNLQYAFASNKDKDDGSGDPPTWTSPWYGIGFSMTFQ
jgi:hypothetical protein